LTFSVIVWHETADAIRHLPDKTRRIIRAALLRLAEDPYPGSHGDKEKLLLKGGVLIYRLHISHSFTAFYEIDKDEKLVLVQDVLTIGQAHKKYGRM
jgi:mRNA-degrading endonuclease RelE of RelBE toxin-antitoxin system